MSVPALMISPRDNVATALEPLERGQTLIIAGQSITVVEATPRGHKIALRLIRAGDDVLKYGSTIGKATSDILPGAHVHTHNLASGRGRGDLHVSTSAEEPRIAEPPDRSPVTGKSVQ